MKKLFMVICVLISWVGISHAQKSKLYTAGYSSDFEIGDPSFSEKVLTLWKDYMSNTLDAHLDLLADTVSITLASGQTVKGKAENLAAVKQSRGSMKDFNGYVDAWVSLKSMDRQQNVVCIWGGENFTDKDGKHVTARVHEVWVFNKDGKVAVMLQFTGQGGM